MPFPSARNAESLFRWNYPARRALSPTGPHIASNDDRSDFPTALFCFGDSNARSKPGFALATFLIVTAAGPVQAQVVSPELEACRSTGLIALRERNPAVKDISFDVDAMTVAKANTKVEDTPIKTIVFGDAYLEKGKKDTRRGFLCLIGEKGKVLLTFFTDK
jgi:hypothetical protein